MPDKKLKDNEIIKALECCKYEYDTKCELCCYNFYSRTGCRSELRRNALDLINRLQAEKEDIKFLYENLKEEHLEIIKAIKHTKAETYKDILNFLECRFVCKGKLTAFGYESAIIDIKNHLKELVGEDNVD